MRKFQYILQKLNIGSLALLASSFQIGIHIFTSLCFVLYIFTSFFLIIISFLNERKDINNAGTKYSLLWHISLLALWLLFPLYHFFEDNVTLYHEELLKHVPLLIIGILGVMQHLLCKKETAFALCSVLWLCRSFIITSVIVHLVILCQTDWSIICVATRPLNIYNSARELYFGEYTHFNLCQNMALLSCFYIYRYSEHKLERVLSMALVPLVFMATFVSPGRIGVITLMIICSFYALLMSRGRKRWCLVLPVVIIANIGAWQLQKQMQKYQRYDRLSTTAIAEEPRFLIWQTTCDLIKERPQGYGAGDGLLAFYKKAEKEPNLYSSFLFLTHPHNSFLLYTLYFGPAGLLTFILILLLPIIIARNLEHKILLAFAVFPFALECCFDVFGIGTPLLLYLIVVHTLLLSSIGRENNQITS